MGNAAYFTCGYLDGLICDYRYYTSSFHLRAWCRHFTSHLFRICQPPRKQYLQDLLRCETSANLPVKADSDFIRLSAYEPLP